MDRAMRLSMSAAVFSRAAGWVAPRYRSPRAGGVRVLRFALLAGLVLLPATPAIADICASDGPTTYPLRLSSTASLQGSFSELGRIYTDAGSGPDREWMSSKRIDLSLVSSAPYANWGGVGVEEFYTGTLEVKFVTYYFGYVVTRVASFEFELNVQWVYFPIDGLSVFTNVPSISFVSGESCRDDGYCVPWSPTLNHVLLCSGAQKYIHDTSDLKIVTNTDFADCESWSCVWSNFDVGVSDVYVPEASLQGLLHSALPLALEEGAPEVREAQVELFRQSGFIQERQPAETEADFQQRLRGELKSLDASALAPPVTVDESSAGRFLFEDLPMFAIDGAHERSMWEPALYMAVVSSASTIESLSAEETWTTKFLTHLEPNLMPDPGDEVNDLYLTPVDDFSAKKNLVSQLIELSPNNYSPIETQVQTWVNTLESGTPTEAQMEGVKRAVWAERVGRDGAIFGNKLLGATLDGYASLYDNLLGELFGRVGTSKSVAKQHAALDSLQAAKSQKLRDRGWLCFSSDPELNLVKDSIKRNLKENPQVHLRVILGVVKKALKAAFALLNTALVSNGVDPSEAGLIVDGIKIPIMTSIDLLMTEGLGTAQPLVAAAAKAIIMSLQDNLFDDDMPYSYCDRTEEYLDYSRQQMEDWPVADQSAYQADRQEVVDVLEEMGRDVSNTLIRANWASTASTSGDFVESAAELFKATPIGRVFWIAGLIAKWAGSAWSFIDPLVGVFTLPGTVEEGVYKAYGGVPPGSRSEASAPQISVPSAPPNAGLDDAVAAAATALDVVFDDLISDLEADDIQAAILTTSGSGPDTVLEATTEFVKATSHFLLQASETQGMNEAVATKLSRLAEQNAEMLEQNTDVGTFLTELYFRVLLLGYDGPTDPLYRVERLRVISAIEKFKTTVDFLVINVNDFASSTSFLDVTPVLTVDDLELASDVTGDARITTTPEGFTLSARVRNLATVDVTDLSARLTINSPEDSVTATSPLEVTVGSGTLLADDGTPGSGTDEADVEWTFDFDGSLDVQERITLLVELLESGGDPTTFVASTEMSLLTFDHSLVDSDRDGIPDDYEQTHGLNVGVNDSEADLDGDGIPNGVECTIFTAADDPDTDDDTLSDGEEIIGGVDGFVTDPLKADTDGDGEPDATDGHPLDPTTTVAPTPADEPAVAVDTALVTLTESSPMGIVNVTNAAGGELQWSAHSENHAIALTSPSIEQIRAGDGTLLIMVPNSFDFTAGDGLVTVVRVLDMLGATADEQQIVVKIGSGAAPNYTLTADLAGQGTGVVTSDDGGISCEPDCTETYAMGSEVVLTATPDPSSVFSGWQGDPDCADGSVVMDISKFCSAVFVPDPSIIFIDGFESGTTAVWSNAVGGSP